MSKKIIQFRLEGSDKVNKICIHSHVACHNQSKAIKQQILDNLLLDENNLVLLYEPNDLEANVALTYDSLETDITYILKVNGKIGLKLFFTFR